MTADALRDHTPRPAVCALTDALGPPTEADRRNRERLRPVDGPEDAATADVAVRRDHERGPSAGRRSTPG